MVGFISKIISLLVAVICTVIPNVNYEAKNEDDILLNAAIISDIHIDASLPIGQMMLTAGLKDVKNNATKNDAVIIPGDLTNYGDMESVEAFYKILSKVNPAEKWIVAPGNHDIGHAEDCTNKQARKRLIEINNRYTGASNKNIYYSQVVNGYTFIVMCDESKDNWDSCDISDKQIKFLDEQLKKATKKSKPAFVICHWPLEYTNGQNAVYEDSAIRDETADKIKAVLKKYKNVFFISGHMHKGISGDTFESVFGFSSVETIKGVTYVNLPSYGIANRYGVPWNGMGMQMEVYKNEVVFRPRRYLHSTWYGMIEYSVPLVK